MLPTSGGTGAVWPAEWIGAPVAGALEDYSAAGPASQTWLRGSSLELPALATAVPRGRCNTRRVLWEWKLAHLVSDAELARQ